MKLSTKVAAFLAVTVLMVFGLVASAALSATKGDGTSTTVTTTAKVVGVSASAKSVATGKVTILEDMLLKGARLNSPNCYWTPGGFWNSGRGVNGNRSYWDPKSGKLCPDKYSPTGYVKVAGGTTGRNCRNVASSGKKPPYPVVKGRIIMVRSLARVRIALTAKAKVVINTTCGPAKIHVEASASASTSVTLRAFVRAKGNVKTRISGKAVAKATAKAQAKVVCTTTTTTTTTTTPVTPAMEVKNVTSLEEVNNDGETYPNLFADVYASNGDSITVVFSVVNPNDHSQGGLGSILGQRSFTFTSHGYDRVGPSTYQAPSDLTAVGRYDQIEVTAHDNSNPSVKDAPSFSLPFPIQATSPNP